LATPLSFQGFNNMSYKKYQIPITNSQWTREQFLANLSPGENSHVPEYPPLRQQISHLKRILTGLTTCLFDKKYSGYNMVKPPFKIFFANKVMTIPNEKISENPPKE
jgi:hypothetical protein